MRIWTELTEQKKVYHAEHGYGIATSESNDGLLFVHFNTDPWNPKRVKKEEVE